ASERCQVLHGGRIGSRRGNDDGVFQRAVLFQLAYYVGNGRLLLTDRDIDTLNAGIFLVNDGVDGDRGFTDLTVTDDQLTLATANRHHRINRFQTDLHRLVN